MYVPGNLDHLDKVTVEIGTGYYAEKVIFTSCSLPPVFDLI